MWRIKVIQSQRENETPDIDVGKLLHQIKKYSANLSLFGRKKPGTVFENIKKGELVPGSYTAQVQSSGSSSSRQLPIEHQKCLAR